MTLDDLKQTPAVPGRSRLRVRYLALLGLGVDGRGRRPSRHSEGRSLRDGPSMRLPASVDAL